MPILRTLGGCILFGQMAYSTPRRFGRRPYKLFPYSEISPAESALLLIASTATDICADYPDLSAAIMINGEMMLNTLSSVAPVGRALQLQSAPVSMYLSLKKFDGKHCRLSCT